MNMSKRLVEVLIRDKGWKPYIKGHYITSFTSRGKAGYIITFHGHEQHEFKCSHQTGHDILELANNNERGM